MSIEFTEKDYQSLAENPSIYESPVKINPFTLRHYSDKGGHKKRGAHHKREKKLERISEKSLNNRHGQ